MRAHRYVGRTHLLTPPVKQSGKLPCIACDAPKAKPPHHVCGHLIPQMCNNCLIIRAGRLELAERKRIRRA